MMMYWAYLTLCGRELRTWMRVGQGANICRLIGVMWEHDLYAIVFERGVTLDKVCIRYKHDQGIIRI